MDTGSPTQPPNSESESESEGSHHESQSEDMLSRPRSKRQVHQDPDQGAPPGNDFSEMFTDTPLFTQPSRAAQTVVTGNSATE